MTPANALTIIVTLLYAGIAVSHYINSAHGLAITFAGYAFANIGLILEGWR